MRRELSEKEILDTVRDIRHEAPGIGAYKLYLMLKELYPDGMRGRPGLVLRAAAQVAADAEAREAPSHDKLQPSLQEVQEHDQGIDCQQDQPIVGGRHHLYRHR